MNPVNEPTHKRQRVIDPMAKQNLPSMAATTKKHTKPEEKPPFKVWTLGELRKQEESGHRQKFRHADAGDSGRYRLRQLAGI